MKSIDEQFRDWESSTFGYGYGTGEEHVLPALRTFLNLCPNRGDGAYSHEALEEALGGATAWLIIDRLCQVDILEYGVSPRFAWLTDEGQRLKTYVSSKTNDELYDIVCGHDETYSECYPDACNCDPNGYKEGLVCHNVFWRGHSASRAA